VLLLQIADAIIEVNNRDQAKPHHLRIAALVGDAVGMSDNPVTDEATTKAS